MKMLTIALILSLFASPILATPISGWGRIDEDVQEAGIKVVLFGKDAITKSFFRRKVSPIYEEKMMSTSPQAGEQYAQIIEGILDVPQVVYIQETPASRWNPVIITSIIVAGVVAIVWIVADVVSSDTDNGNHITGDNNVITSDEASTEEFSDQSQHD